MYIDWFNHTDIITKDVKCAVYYTRRQNHKQTDREQKKLEDKMPNAN